MFKLIKDNKKIKNVKIDNINKYILYVETASFILLVGYISFPSVAKKNNEMLSQQYSSFEITGTTGTQSISSPISTYSKEDSFYETYGDEISHIADVYGLNPDFIKKMVFARYDNNEEIFEHTDDYSSIEAQTILLCHDIKRNPSKYYLDVNEDNILSEPLKESDLTIRELIYKYSKIFGVDGDLALAIACAESGDFECGIATYKNNPFALRGNEYFIFDSLERGIIEGIITLKTGYIDRGLDTPAKMERVYAGSDSNGHWSSMVIGKMNNIDNLILYDETKNKQLTMN